MWRAAVIRSISVLLILAAVHSAVPARAQDLTRLGGDLTSDMPAIFALELPAPNIASRERFLYHVDGHQQFHGSFEQVLVNDKLVLGPGFNHNSCGGCHFKDGRGTLGFGRLNNGSSMIVKVGLRGLNADGTVRGLPGIGEQLQDRTVGGKRRYALRLKWTELQGSYPDGTAYSLRRPRLNFNIPRVNPRKVVASLRMTPPVIGMGLLEAVSFESLHALSDPSDRNQDGISGRLNWVLDAERGGYAAGRFGFKATHPTVRQQTGAAFFNDMGMTNTMFHHTPEKIEVEQDTLDKVVFYQQVAGVTQARYQSFSSVIAGKQLFQDIGCDDCHTMTLHTGETAIPELANQTFHPFTDLLLHDMGRELSDRRPEFGASGKEWRTPPLWGLGLVEVLQPDGEKGFLHDGRARTIEEAILWHGGEGKASREAFKNLDAEQRELLLLFLASL